MKHLLIFNGLKTRAGSQYVRIINLRRHPSNLSKIMFIPTTKIILMRRGPSLERSPEARPLTNWLMVKVLTNTGKRLNRSISKIQLRSFHTRGLEPVTQISIPLIKIWIIIRAQIKHPRPKCQSSLTFGVSLKMTLIVQCQSLERGSLSLSIGENKIWTPSRRLL